MALTKKQLQVSEMYLRYYGEVPSNDEIDSILSKNGGSIKKVLKEVKTTSTESKTASEQINDVFNNLFGRNATPTEIEKFEKSATKGTLSISKIIKSVPKEDKAVYKNKADAVIVSKTLGIDIDVKTITKDNPVDTKAIADTYVSKLIEAVLGREPSSQKEIDKLSKSIIKGKEIAPKDVLKVATSADKKEIKLSGGIEEVTKNINLDTIKQETQQKADDEVAVTPTEPTPTEPTTPEEPTNPQIPAVLTITGDAASIGTNAETILAALVIKPNAAVTITGAISAAQASTIGTNTTGIVTATVTATGVVATLDGALTPGQATDALTLVLDATSADISNLVSLNGKTSVAVDARTIAAITDTTNIGADFTTAGITWGSSVAITTGTAATFTSNQTSHTIAAGNIVDDSALVLAGSANYTVTGLKGNLTSTSTGDLDVTLASVANSTVAFGTSTAGTHSVNADALTTTQVLTLTGSDAASVTLVAGGLSAAAYVGDLTVTSTASTTNETITTGTGNDTITVNTIFNTVNGTSGTDTLKLNVAGSLDLSSTTISNIDTIDMTVNAADTNLTLTGAQKNLSAITANATDTLSVKTITGLSLTATSAIDTFIAEATATGVSIDSLAIGDKLDVSADSSANLDAAASADAVSVLANGNWFFDDANDVLTYWDTAGTIQAITLTGVASVTTTGDSEIFTIATLG